MNRLNNSSELKRYASQFVTTKIPSSGTQFSEFHSKYRNPDSYGIPYMYIVRSDGERIWSGGAEMKVPEMAKILQSAIAQSGVSINESQAELLTKAQVKISELLESEDVEGAVAQLRKVAKFGPAGEIPSFAKSAVELNAVATSIVDSARGKLEPIVEKLTAIDGGSQTATEAESVSMLSELQDLMDVYAVLKPLKPLFTKAKKLIKDSDELNLVQRDLRAIRSTESAKTTKSIENAMKKLNVILERRESGAIFDLAKARVGELDGNAGN